MEQRKATYAAENIVFGLLVIPMTAAIWLCWTDIGLVSPKLHLTNICVIVVGLMILQAGRAWLEHEESTEAGHSPIWKSLFDWFRNCLVFVTCYVSIFQRCFACMIFGAFMALLILATVVKYRVYDDFFRYRIHEPGSPRHIVKGNTGHLMMRCVADQLPRAYLFTAFAFSIFELLLMNKPFEKPCMSEGAFAVANPSGNPLADFFYFNIVTIATVGYGDVTPKTAAAKMLCSAEVLFSILILATIVVTLIGRFQKIASEQHVDE